MLPQFALYSTGQGCVNVQRVLVKKKVDQMAYERVAEATTTKVASPIVSVPKMKECFRFWDDYRRLSAVTEKRTAI